MSENVTDASRKTVPLQEGLFAQGSDGKYHLIASHCKACELTFFPRRKYCGKCGSSDMDEIGLSDCGKVHTFCLIDRKSKFAIIEPPYIQAEIEMPEGVHVFTVLDKCDPQTVTIGMAVQVYVEKVKQDEEGNDVVAYKFRPVA